jgi:plasmid stabilization system protein ParE
MYRDDYLLRMIEQLAAAIARLAGLNDRGDHDQALAAADRLWNELLDGPGGIPDGLDSRTLAALLRRPAQVKLAHQIACEQARALAGKGDAVAAAAQYRRALELLLEARALAPRTGHGDEAVIAELLRHVPRDALAPRYRAMLPDEPQPAGVS